jgi:hypothetical protein
MKIRRRDVKKCFNILWHIRKQIQTIRGKGRDSSDLQAELLFG